MSDLVLVIGGTRGTGRLIAHMLLQRGTPVRVLARDPDRAASRLDSSIEVVRGDITKPETLLPALQGAEHIIFTAGVHSGRIAGERLVRATDYLGPLSTVEAARSAGLRGRFVYLNSLGVTTPSPAARFLNLLKRNTLVWRRRVEERIRASDLDYTVIRVGFLSNRPGGVRAIRVSQSALPLALGNRIARADAAEAFVEAVNHPRTSRTTFDIVWGRGSRGEWASLFGRLKPDP